MNLNSLGADAPNIDHTTGIRFGWIDTHSVTLDAIETICTDGDDLTYAGAVADAKERIADALYTVLDDLSALPLTWADDAKAAKAECVALAQGVWERVEQTFNDHYESDNTTYRYERDGYLIEYSGTSLVVLRSPFYTYCAFGSPCIPNGGDLNTVRAEADGGIRTYCLGVDWFDKDVAPYPVYVV